MKLKVMIALVILALVFGMTFTACDDGEAPEIKYTYKPGTTTVTTTIYDAGLIGTYDENPTSDTFGKVTYTDEHMNYKDDTTTNAKPTFPAPPSADW